MDFLEFVLKLNNLKMRNKNNFDLNIYFLFQNRQQLRFLDVNVKAL